MAQLGPAAWPPSPIKTKRLTLQLERAVPEIPGGRPGFFVADLDGVMIGMVTLDRRDAERLGHIRPEGEEAELGYMYLPHAWGHGYATEAGMAALQWLAGVCPGSRSC